MSFTEILSLVESLPHADKFRLMQILLAQIAREEGVSLQELETRQQDPLWDIVGMAEGEESDVARRHDHYLYGAKR